MAHAGNPSLLEAEAGGLPRVSETLSKQRKGSGRDSVVEHVPSLSKALGSIPNKNKEKNHFVNIVCVYEVKLKLKSKLKQR